MKTIAILLTVHNRKEKTLQCLNHLFKQNLVEGYGWDIFMTNDGCTDGTPQAVKNQYPQVKIIDADGSLFWNRGMHKAWTVAAETKDYDFYLWLNDDTILKNNALNDMCVLSEKLNHQSIIVGATADGDDSAEISYGGYTKKGVLLIPESKQVECSYFNGNIVLIPRYVFELVGTNDPVFRHALGDFDYGLRAATKGVRMYVAPGILGVCKAHETLPVWCNPDKPFMTRWKAFRTALGHNPEEFFIYEKRHNGYGAAIFHYLTNHLRLIYPKLWKA